ncbi:EpsG family protein [Cupriavidus taiwanensis]|uniref:EpsG family protein n=1 Tax=Cupriavidus taiwanensis (strain DSM 17343 / BCRC 17206 / CCUG 44338 / CIP 107171 / LMG 19424 / R1) TaxID=977880 RepID=B3R5Z4_CUPTR|nr:EpsG family protein [Cupriavidus taiwanensis]CAQ70310.1 conserved hypothetical protein; putative Lipopolysaccharide export membrane protein [Cupriavidus taiwanensis LMG 19424]
MFLTDIVLLASALGLSSGIGVRLLKVRQPSPHVVGGVTAAAFIIVMMCFRSLQFGVDTAAYANIFSDFCKGGLITDRESSFQIATEVLNFTMLGSCDTQLLPAVWVLLIVLPALFFRAPWQVRLCYISALLLSLVGIELSTNALRQGLSTGWLVFAVSLAPITSLLTVLFSAVAMAFHPSAGLVLLGYLLARQRWKIFLPLVVGLLVLTVHSLNASIELPLVSRFLYEIRKYLAHEDSELWIRILSFACVVAALLAPQLSRFPEVSIPAVMADRYYAVALRMAIVCLPFLALPYFGYRFIYGMYPIILFLTLSPTLGNHVDTRRQFLLLCAMNVTILLVWAAGSTYMRDLPFIG